MTQHQDDGHSPGARLLGSDFGAYAFRITLLISFIWTLLRILKDKVRR